MHYRVLCCLMPLKKCEFLSFVRCWFVSATMKTQRTVYQVKEKRKERRRRKMKTRNTSGIMEVGRLENSCILQCCYRKSYANLVRSLSSTVKLIIKLVLYDRMGASARLNNIIQSSLVFHSFGMGDEHQCHFKGLLLLDCSIVAQFLDYDKLH